MCEWNVLFEDNAAVIQADLGDNNERRQIDVPQKPGVYVVRVMSRNRPKSIQRMFAADRNGILHFGRTSNLKARIGSFLRGTRTGREHSAAMRYHSLRNEYEQHGYSLVQIGYQARTLNRAEKLEKKWFDMYANNFGELPPLDSRRG